MAIIYDARWLGPHGIGRYAAEVATRCGMTPIALAGRPLALDDPWRLRRYLLTHRPGHFFSPGFNAPLGRPGPFSLTVHDLIHLEVPEECSPVKRAYYEWVVKPAVRNADVVFTGSEFSRQRIAGWARVDAERIVLTGHGVGPLFQPEGPYWRNDRPYLLYVGNQKPHKNVEGLVRAYAHSRLGEDFDLLLTGAVSRSVTDIAKRMGIVDQVKGLGLVPERHLPSLYRGAHALIMPSLYEGFGLPVIEAMACSTPVLCSNRTALPEVGGDAVHYFDPEDQESFVEGLRTLLDDERLSGLRARGLQRAGLFNWDEVAERIQRAIGSSGAS